MAEHHGDHVRAGMPDAGTGPIPVPGGPADGPASTTAPRGVPQAWATAPGPPAGFAPAPPPGAGPYPPPMAAVPGPAAAQRPPAFGRPARQQRPSPQSQRPQPQRPLRRSGRNAAVRAFVLHQFPIGHMPVAASHASMQLPLTPESDAVVGLRFPPADHPQSSLIDDTDALARARSGAVDARPVADGAPVPDELVVGHEPFGDVTEREWEHEFLVRQGVGEEVGYAWPPTDSLPSTDQAEALLLETGTVLDRIGTDIGRILAPAGTPFAQRSVPPEYRDRAFQRYRVLRRLPVWRTLSAPWFGQPGGGISYRTTAPVADLVALGYLGALTTRGQAEEPTVRLKASSGALGEQ